MRSPRRRFLSELGAAGLAAWCPGLLPAAQEAVPRETLAADPLRPQFHLLPARNWMNDPNAPMYREGRYHMFFQHNPYAPVWGPMHWAHAVSTDMLHWKHLPVALRPTAGGADGDGCFTGSGVDDHGTATVLYTGVTTAPPERATLRDGVHNFLEVQCLATSSDAQLTKWKKQKAPVLVPPADPRLAGFRDPFLFRDKAAWYMGVGAGFYKEGGRVLLYRSADLRKWDYASELASGPWTGKESVNPVDSGEMWECPDFFALGAKHVLLYSTAGQVVWETGDFDPRERRFHMHKRGVLDHGAYYAQKTQLDAGGGRILWGWIPETRPEAEFRRAGWAGSMALPRELRIDAQGGLGMHFLPAARALRAKAVVAAGIADAVKRLEIQNLAGELLWRHQPVFSTFTLRDKTGPWWSVRMEPRGETLALDVNGTVLEVPADPRRPVEFHLFLDASVAELMVDGKHAVTTRRYRQPDGPLRVAPENLDTAAFSQFAAWQLRPISPDRLTS